MSGATVETATEIRPFHVDVPEEDLADLRRRTLRGDPRRIQITALRRSS